MEEKHEDLEERLTNKCEKKEEKIAKVCEALDHDECPENVENWVSICKKSVDCKAKTIRTKAQCEGQFKAMMFSFRSMDPPANDWLTPAKVGECFTEMLEQGQDCSNNRKEDMRELLEDMDVTVEQLKEAKKSVKAEMKKKFGGGRKNWGQRRVGQRKSNRRGQRKGGRRGRGGKGRRSEDEESETSDKEEGSTRAEYEENEDDE